MEVVSKRSGVFLVTCNFPLPLRDLERLDRAIIAQGRENPWQVSSSGFYHFSCVRVSYLAALKVYFDY